MDRPTIDQSFQVALQHQQAGRLPQAEQIYRQILAQQPNYVPALHFLGLIAHQAGRNDAAVDLIRRAIALNPNDAGQHSNLARVLLDLGRSDEAIVACRAAIALAPNFPEAHYNLGSALQAREQLDEAITAFLKAIALNPRLAEAHNNLGNALKDKGQLYEAAGAFRQAISLKPNYAEAYNNLGIALRAAGQLDQAIGAYRQAIALKPNSPDVYYNLGNALTDIGQLDEAVAAHNRAIALRPAYAEAYSNLGNALKAKGQRDEAIAAYRQAIAVRPNYADAHFNLGIVLTDAGEVDEAIAAYRQAIALRPGFSAVYYDLGNALQGRGQFDEAIAAYREAIGFKHDDPYVYCNLGNVLKNQGRLDEAIAAYRQAIAVNSNLPDIHSNLVYTLNFHSDCDAQAVAEEQSRWNIVHAEPLKKFIQPPANNRDPDRRLRIGYVSPDFCNHCQAHFMTPLLSVHDHREVEIFCYADVSRPHEFTRRLQGHADVWRDILGQPDEQVASRIREDQIDILVDLTMHMARNRLLLFARKPAPVQVSWLAYPGSTGLTAIDYRLSDPYLDPPGIDGSIYSEKTIRLPDSFWCYDPLYGRDVPINPLPALSLSNGSNAPAASESNGPAGKTGVVTFGWLNNFCKINDGTLALWAQVMNSVQGSRLLLLAGQGSHRQRIVKSLASQGVDPGRIEFIEFRPQREYFEVYQRIDVGLDSFPYNGHTTSLDSFWMGVPVVTLIGQTAVSRAGWCQLSNLGLTELAGQTAEQFVQIAVELANDLPRLSHLRSTLRGRMEQSPLMDAPRFARNIEAAYRRMWRQWCADVR